MLKGQIERLIQADDVRIDFAVSFIVEKLKGVGIDWQRRQVNLGYLIHNHLLRHAGHELRFARNGGVSLIIGTALVVSITTASEYGDQKQGQVFWHNGLIGRDKTRSA